jgi:hypothetical protein
MKKPNVWHPYHPAIMLGVILYGIMKNRFTLRELEEMSKTDVCCMWLAGGVAIDFTTFSRFMTKHEDLLTDEFFEQITKKVLSVIGKKVFTISIDGTVIQAAASRYKSLKLEAAKAEAERAKSELEKNSDDKKSKKKVEHAERVVEIVKQRAEARKKNGKKPEDTQVSPTEPEAAIQRTKEENYKPSYKPSIAASKDRIIVGKDVHPTSETKPVPEMLDQAQKLCDSTIERGLIDAGYFNSNMFNEFINRDLDVMCPEGKATQNDNWNKKSSKYFHKNQFEYDEKTNTYKCPNGKHLELLCHSRKGKNSEESRIYRCKDFDVCPLKDKCMKGSTPRTIKRYKGDEDKEIMREVMKDPRAKEIYRKRKGAVEPVFSEIRGVQGLRRFRRKGLNKVKMEFSLHAITYNIRRMFALTELPKILASSTLFFVFQFFTLLTKIISRFSKTIKKLFPKVKSKSSASNSQKFINKILKLPILYPQNPFFNTLLQERKISLEQRMLQTEK